jgi:hypothetical protein
MIRTCIARAKRGQPSHSRDTGLDEQAVIDRGRRTWVKRRMSAPDSTERRDHGFDAGVEHQIPVEDE